MLSFKDSEEVIINNKVIAALADEVLAESVQPVPSPILSLPGLEIRQHERRVLRDGTDVNLTRLEYGTLAYLVSSPRWVFTQQQFLRRFGTWKVIAVIPA